VNRVRIRAEWGKIEIKMNFIFNHLEIILTLLFLTILGFKLRRFFRRKEQLRNVASRLNVIYSEKPLDEQSDSGGFSPLFWPFQLLSAKFFRRGDPHE
jgi:hypothetical protein